MTSFTGTSEVDLFRAVTLKSGLKMWRDLKMKPNSAWTPRAMMRTAARLTGETFSARDYTGAIKALEKYIEDGKLQQRIKENG
jgi:hypothetical protein